MNYEKYEDPRRRIIRECAEEFGITVADMQGTSRKHPMPAARKAAAERLYKRGTMSINLIGKFLNKDHTTILHALRDVRISNRKKRKDEHEERCFGDHEVSV